MLNICITADHEIFSGENIGPEEEIIIHPTYSLMNVLEQFNIPLCLMTDVCSLIRYKNLNIDSSYVQLMEDQLCYAINKGHDVQLHIHPHWFISDYVDGKWKYDDAYFRLHSFGFGELSVHGYNGRQIIALGKKYLEDLLKPINNSYECIAFRAGGWCLQPEKELLLALSAEGILIDTTVYYGGFHNGKNRFFDFRHVPQKPNWWIDPYKGLEFESSKTKGHLYEVAIGSYGFLPLLSLKKLILKTYRTRMKRETSLVKGKSIDALVKRTYFQRIVNSIKQLFLQPILFSFDSACLEVLVTLLNYYLKRFDCVNHEIYVSIIGHPKILTERSLEEVKKFCVIVTEKYSQQVRFIRFSDISAIN